MSAARSALWGKGALPGSRPGGPVPPCWIARPAGLTRAFTRALTRAFTRVLTRALARALIWAEPVHQAAQGLRATPAQ